MRSLTAFQEFLQAPRKVLVIPHYKPDADALGSALGLAGYLAKKKHYVTVVSPSDYPEFLKWLPGNERVEVFHPEKHEYFNKLITDCDIVFCVDFSSLSRINELGDMVLQSGARKAMIDHHLEPEKFAEFEQWDDTAASTAELVFELIRELGDEHLIDADIASCLYAGLMTDTGGFRHSNTSKNVFETAAALVSHGADPARISKLIYDTNTLERMRLMGFVLYEKLQVLPEYNTAYIALRTEDQKRFSSQTGDTEGLVNFGLSVKGVKLAVLISERKDVVKLSFRSLGNFSVNDFARKHFNGGGHKNAAGGQSNLSFDETVRKFLDLLPQYQTQLQAE